MASSHGIKTDLTSSFQEPTKYQSSSSITCLLEKPRDDISYGEEKYLTRLLVSRNSRRSTDQVDQLLVPDEPHDQPHNTNTGFEKRNENIDGCHEEVIDKIHKALTLLILRDKCNLIQFWSPSYVGKYKLLGTVDQPFGLGIRDEGLFHYRRESERNWFYVDEECGEEDLVPVVRVFRRQFPEWTSNITNYNTRNHPLKDCAIRWNLRGYLVLPVFDSVTMTCVGVFECITSSKYLDCAYEVQEVHRALKAANLTSPQAFDCPTSNIVDYKNREHELDEIFKFLKDVCDIHKLPLAQTWRVSSRSSFVVTGRNIEMTCSSFNSSCTGKVCISTSGLPFYLHDLRFWNFREACSEHHLLKSKGVVGRALASHGSCFCADVTKLGEDEYSLVHNARMIGLTSCFSIYLHSIEHDDGYLLEFFLPVNMKETSDLHKLVQNLDLHVKLSSFRFEDPFSTEVIGMPTAISQQSLSTQLHIIQTSLSKEIMRVDSKESQTAEESNAQNDCIIVQDQCDFAQVYTKNPGNAVTNTEGMSEDDTKGKKIDIVNGDQGACMKQRRTHQSDPLTSEHIQNEVSISFGSFSRDIRPLDSQTAEEAIDQIDCINAQDEDDIGSDNHKNWITAVSNTAEMPVDDATSRKVDLGTGEKQNNSGEEGASTKQRKSISLIPEEKYYGNSVGEVSMSLGSLSIDRLQLDSQTVQEISYQIDCINVQDGPDPDNGYHKNSNIVVTNTHESCLDDDVIGKTNDIVAGGKSCNSRERGSTKRKRKRKMDSVTPETIQQYFGKPIGEASRKLGVSRSTLKRVCRKLNIPSWPMPRRNKKYPHFGIHAVVFLLVKVKRWSCSSNRHGFSGRWWICGMHNPFVSKSNPSIKESDDSMKTATHFSEPPEKNVVSVSDTRMVTVKATFKDDMIKFQIPLSSRLSELKDQVAQRIKLENTKLLLKYMDEDNDLILIACDADLRNLMPFTATQSSKNAIKLIVQMSDN